MARKLMREPAVVWIALSIVALVAGIKLASGERLWSVVPTGLNPVDQAIAIGISVELRGN